MNPWLRGPLDKNPYARTAFRVARVPPEVVKHKTVVNAVNQTKQLVERAPGTHAIQGEAVTRAEVLAAEQTLLDPQRRIVEELLEHAAERYPTERIAAVVAEVDRLLAPPAGPLPVVRPAALAALLDDLVRQFLASSPAGNPSLGALELDVIPPFGREEEF